MVIENMTIKQIRMVNNLTQRQFAESVGMKFETYRRKEMGQRKLNADELVKIAKTYNIQVEHISLD